MANNSLKDQLSRGEDCDGLFRGVIAADVLQRDRCALAKIEAVTRPQSDQVVHEIAEIERAAAALCKAEPTLQIWTGALNDPLAGTPTSAWRSIGLVWVSAILIAASAIAAITQLTGQVAGRLFGQQSPARCTSTISSKPSANKSSFETLGSFSSHSA